MKQVITIVVCCCSAVLAYCQPPVNKEELRKNQNPYLPLLPAYITRPFTLEKLTSRDGLFYPEEEQFDYFNSVSDDWQPAFKYEYDYQGNGSLLHLNEHNYNAFEQSWTHTKRVSYTYDVFALPDSVIEEVYNAAAVNLVPQTLLQLTHSPEGNLEQEQISNWNMQASDWLPDHKHGYSYTISGKEQSVVHADWVDTSQEWNPYEEYHSLYNANDNLVRYLGLAWNMELLAWLPATKDTIEYDLFQNLQRITSASWSPSDTLWTPYYRNEYEHDETGNLTGITGLFWEESIHDFQNSIRYLFHFSGEVMDEAIFQVWNNGNLDWDHLNRTVYVYDSLSLLTEKVIYSWTGSSWAESYRYLYVQDAYGNVIQSTGQSWNNNTATWKDIERYSASWISFTTHNNQELNEYKSAIVFPNPANQYLLVDGLLPHGTYLAILTDLAGNVKLETTFLNAQSIPLKGLTAGVYLIYIKENGRNVVAACKLIISN